MIFGVFIWWAVITLLIGAVHLVIMHPWMLLVTLIAGTASAVAVRLLDLDPYTIKGPPGED